MLAIKTTEKLTGVTVSGTYGELNALYDAVRKNLIPSLKHAEFVCLVCAMIFATLIRATETEEKTNTAKRYSRSNISGPR